MARTLLHFRSGPDLAKTLSLLINVILCEYNKKRKKSLHIQYTKKYIC